MILLLHQGRLRLVRGAFATLAISISAGFCFASTQGPRSSACHSVYDNKGESVEVSASGAQSFEVSEELLIFHFGMRKAFDHAVMPQESR